MFKYSNTLKLVQCSSYCYSHYFCRAYPKKQSKIINNSSNVLHIVSHSTFLEFTLKKSSKIFDNSSNVVHIGIYSTFVEFTLKKQSKIMYNKKAVMFTKHQPSTQNGALVLLIKYYLRMFYLNYKLLKINTLYPCG